jgi:signal transduction histidine kinase
VPETQPLGGGIRKVFDKIVRGVVEGLGYTGAVLAVVNELDRSLLVQAIAYSNFTDRQNWSVIENRFGVRIIGGTVSLEHDRSNLAVQSCVSGKTRFTHELYDLFKPLVSEKMASLIQSHTRIRTSLAIPLTANKTVVGALCAGTEKEEIPPSDLDALYYFATNAAIAIQNSLYIDQVSRDLAMREAELSQLRRIERMIHSSLNVEKVLKHILNGAIELTGADYGQVVLAGKYASGLLQRVWYPDSLDVTRVEPAGLSALMTSRALPDLDAVSTLIKRNNSYGLKRSGSTPNGNRSERSMLGVPISLDEELVGVINIGSERVDAFSDRALDMLEQIGVQAAIAIRNAYHFKTEQEIRERLVNVSQVVAMGDMAGNMVHSINNWVGAIRSDLNLLLRALDRGEEQSPEELGEIYHDILANAEATLAMAENIKKPFQSLEQEPIDVNLCISQVLRDKRPEMANVIAIEDFSPVPRVMATRQLELVFENLINNSLQAMKELVCGLLRCTTRLSKDGQWVEVTVEDTGPGLPEQLSPTDIFKLGVSGRKNGMGYGLWWSDTFLKRWGGQIEFVENRKRGCKFLVRLPILNETTL